MFKPRTLQILALLAVVYALILLPGYFNPAYFDGAIGIFLLIPLVSVYLFHQLGIPGLLLNKGLCAGGWCAPTLLGWVLAAIAVLLSLWLLAWAIASLSTKKKRSTPGVE